MRIVQYHPRAMVGDGGITNSVRRLSAAMRDHGADPIIVYDEPDTPPDEMWVGLRHRGPRGLRVPVGLASALESADVLVCNSAWTLHNAVAAGSARKHGVPYVLAPRGAYDPRIRQRRRHVKDLWWRALERRTVEGARAIHVFFPEESAHLEALGYRGDTLVAPNGVAVHDDVRWDGGTGEYLLYLGRFDPEHKGLDLLVRAAASLPAGRIPTLRLHGPDWRGGKQAVRALVEQLGATDRVAIGDAVYSTEKWDLLRRATGFVYPSRWEAFGNSVAEAAAIGVPTLVTPYPLGRYLARRGAAVLAEPDVSSLREGLQRLCSPSAGDLGKAASQIALRELTWPSVAQSWLEQLARLLRPLDSGEDVPT